MASSSATNPDTLVALKVNIDGSNRRFKLPLRDLGASTLPQKLRGLLSIPDTSEVIVERYSDSAAAFVTLDPENASVYKQLYRAAKAKLKLRLKVTVINKQTTVPKPASVEDEIPSLASMLPSITQQPLFDLSPFDAPVTAPAPEASAPITPSVADIQRGFEDLLLSQPAPRQKKHAPVRLDLSTEIPVTHGSASREKWFAELADATSDRQSALRGMTGPPIHSTYSVYCNKCSSPIPDEHYHCSTCDDGDFDLCQTCVDGGVLCDGDDHWLIKRFVKNGKVINSTTETIAPKASFSYSRSCGFSSISVPETVSEPTLLHEEAPVTLSTRTCNSCVQEFIEERFVTCLACDDFDLCVPCHVGLQHGHHPSHEFAPACAETVLSPLAKALLKPGRNASHLAICDGCDSHIYGVRHKCLDCPDWDYCPTCVTDAHFIHPRHRFVPIYEPISDNVGALGRLFSKSRHHGIFCDGPLCNNSVSGASTYITGDRYKCAVCHDTDFCANCEASPSNLHNKTHPLIKFKTPVRNVSVTTMGDHQNGPMPLMGDRPCRTSFRSVETVVAPSVNAATQVQTVADLQPTEATKAELSEKSAISSVPERKDELVANFVRDTVRDGSVLPANCVFEQTWTLRNGGNVAWPAGCTVKYVGGDNMCAVDPEHPASVHELVSAAESTTCYTEVAPGQEFGFTVLMRTPNRAGKVISYWRLTGPTGLKFGHRLWCDVDVAAPVVKEEIREEVKEEVEEETEADDEVDEETEEETKPEETSQMIFPKLEKESPTSSIHEELLAETPEVAEAADDDFLDVEDDETEDGFMTDEEYDILDASDEEYLHEQSKISKK